MAFPTAPTLGQIYISLSGNTYEWSGSQWIISRAAASIDADTLDGFDSDAFLQKAGGTMSGSVDMGGQALTGLPAPSSSSDAATKSYVDTQVASVGPGSALQTTGGTMTGPLVLASDPTSGLQAATKSYVDTQLAAVSGGTIADNSVTMEKLQDFGAPGFIGATAAGDPAQLTVAQALSVLLPSNGAGSLTNDGSGNLTWSQPTVSYGTGSII